jgi:uncharacterized protein (TIGR02246 family)
MRIRLSLLVLAALLAGCSNASQPSSPEADVQSETAKLRQADAAWLAAVKARDVERTASFWADDARIYPPGQPVVTGRAAIRKYVADSFATPGFAITWKLEELQVSAAGGMAYMLASNHVSLRGPDGKPIELDGRAVAIWRKQPDGSWKCVVDIWNQ